MVHIQPELVAKVILNPQINEFENVLDRYSLAATRGLARSLWSDLGLPNNVINQLYKKPMTIKLNLRSGRMKAVQDGTF